MVENGMRLIDANELDGKLEALAQKYAAQGRPEVAKDYSFVQTVLLTARTVDVVEVVHGRWEIVEPKCYPDLTARIRCSACKKNPKSTATKSAGTGMDSQLIAGTLQITAPTAVQRWMVMQNENCKRMEYLLRRARRLRRSGRRYGGLAQPLEGVVVGLY